LSDGPPTPRVLAPGEGVTYDFLGHTFCDKVTTAEGCQFCVQEIVQRAGGEPPLHVHHREDEAFYVLAGRMTFHLGGRDVDVGPGSFVLAPRGVPHTFTVEGDEARILQILGPNGTEAAFRELAGQAVDPAVMAAALAPYGVEIVGPPPGRTPA
jgi:mannose-6-phosphate isomerase-like protein (cupin superfamily)